MEEKRPQINITSKSAGGNVIEELILEANARGITPNSLMAQILETALSDKDTYDSRLKKARSKNGSAYNVRVNIDVKRGIEVWSKEKGSTLSSHCNFIFEKWLESTQK